MFNLPADAIAAIERGDDIDAIKRVREHTGLGLKESKDAVDRYRNGDRSALASVATAAAAPVYEADETFAAPPGALPASALAALARGRKVNAVMRVREATGLGLAEAKRLVDAHVARHGSTMGGAGFGAALGDPMAEPGRVRTGPWRGLLTWGIVGVILLLGWLYLAGRL